MMKFRAQSFTLRDSFPDILSGVYDEYEFEEIQTTSKNITEQTVDLSKGKGTEGLKDILNEENASEPSEVEIQDKKGKTIHKSKKTAPTPQEKPENIDQIKTDFTRWAKEKIISKEEYTSFTDAGSVGEWGKVTGMHKEFFKRSGDKPLGKFAKKLSEIVDDEKYSESINSLIGDKDITVIGPKNAGDILRTKVEKTAKEIFELIESRKDMIDSSKNEK